MPWTMIPVCETVGSTVFLNAVSSDAAVAFLEGASVSALVAQAPAVDTFRNMLGQNGWETADSCTAGACKALGEFSVALRRTPADATEVRALGLRLGQRLKRVSNEPDLQNLSRKAEAALAAGEGADMSANTAADAAISGAIATYDDAGKTVLVASGFEDLFGDPTLAPSGVESKLSVWSSAELPSNYEEGLWDEFNNHTFLSLLGVPVLIGGLALGLFTGNVAVLGSAFFGLLSFVLLSGHRIGEVDFWKKMQADANRRLFESAKFEGEDAERIAHQAAAFYEKTGFPIAAVRMYEAAIQMRETDKSPEAKTSSARRRFDIAALYKLASSRKMPLRASRARALFEAAEALRKDSFSIPSPSDFASDEDRKKAADAYLQAAALIDDRYTKAARRFMAFVIGSDGANQIMGEPTDVDGYERALARRLTAFALSAAPVERAKALREIAENEISLADDCIARGLWKRAVHLLWDAARIFSEIGDQRNEYDADINSARHATAQARRIAADAE